ncbi:MAG: AraC family transcriptional regulator [Pseudomonadota bacterium]
MEKPRLDIVENVARGFGLTPLASLRLGDGPAPFAAAAFAGRGARLVSSEPDRRYAIAAVHLQTPFDVDLELDAARVFAGRVNPGEFVMVPPGARPEAEVGGTWSVLHLYLPVDLVTRLNPNWHGHTGRGLWYGPRAGLRDLAHRAAAEMADTSPAAQLAAEGTLRQLAAQLIPTLTRAPSPERLAPHALRRVVSLIDAEYATPLTVAALADAAGLGEAHFARAFRNTTGKTPGEAIRARRMAAARSLLAETDLPILEVAAVLGYADPGFFARLFRRDHGAAPAAWRRARRGG